MWNLHLDNKLESPSPFMGEGRDGGCDRFTPHLCPPPQGGRKVLFSVLALTLFFSIRLFAGTISGKSAFEGTPGANPRIDMSADPVCKSLNPADVFAQRIVVNSNGTLQNVFVYIKEGLSETSFPVPAVPAVLDQRSCNYHPHVLGMQANQKLQIINSDATLHNIHAFAKNSPEFNLGMPIQGMKLEKTFSNPEIMVKMKCDVHPWMNAYAGVLAHPYFSVSGDDGTFNIKDLPAGEYTVEAWHEKYGTQTQKVTVGEEPVNVEFTFA